LVAGPAWALSPNFDSIKKDIFIGRGCMDCHGKAPVLERLPLHDYRLVMNSPHDLVLPGNPTESGLLIAVTRNDKKRMPPPNKPKYKPLTPAEVNVIRQWIKLGAPEHAKSSDEIADTWKAPADPGDLFYRDLLKTLRRTGTFKVSLPAMAPIPLSYRVTVSRPKTAKPVLIDINAGEGGRFLRQVFDKLFFDDNSVLKIGDDELPLTCVHLDGQDNRFTGPKSPLTPDFILRIFLVANDYSCTGPLNQDPSLGPVGPTWDTFLYYEVRDPSTMFPINARLHYRGNNFAVTRLDTGGTP
jgi:hypothetical protein